MAAASVDLPPWGCRRAMLNRHFGARRWACGTGRVAVRFEEVGAWSDVQADFRKSESG